ncbi:hypothetical protein ACUXIL_003303 [Ralstonia pickettii]|nr:hypothetical protein [Ralstonia pickettii]MBA9851989.1 hypothetical protein [Ralstonia pickettii]MBA9919996.1 hypothetical protein [Ralstonia pickettii]MBA9959098.1 hypothetical protein [Ralstonia pickettii]MBA9964524.1 hypothetical protein [Ralstonia pickettii]
MAEELKWCVFAGRFPGVPDHHLLKMEMTIPAPDCPNNRERSHKREGFQGERSQCMARFDKRAYEAAPI